MSELPPTQQHPERGKAVREMFQAISPSYDRANRILSMGVDMRWRRQTVQAALANKPQRILDVATGTADLAIALKKAAPSAEVIGVDFAENMLAVGRDKAQKQGVHVHLETGDGMHLPYADASFDVVTIAYGLRNFSDYGKGLQEFYRVLKPEGRLVVLEFPPPPKHLFGQFFRFYFFRISPFIGGLISGNMSAYRYLPQSVLNFPPAEVLKAMMLEQGFSKVSYQLQTFGVSALHIAGKS